MSAIRPSIDTSRICAVADAAMFMIPERLFRIEVDEFQIRLICHRREKKGHYSLLIHLNGKLVYRVRVNDKHTIVEVGQANLGRWTLRLREIAYG